MKHEWVKPVLTVDDLQHDYQNFMLSECKNCGCRKRGSELFFKREWDASFYGVTNDCSETLVNLVHAT